MTVPSPLAPRTPPTDPRRSRVQVVRELRTARIGFALSNRGLRADLTALLALDSFLVLWWFASACAATQTAVSCPALPLAIGADLLHSYAAAKLAAGALLAWLMIHGHRPGGRVSAYWYAAVTVFVAMAMAESARLPLPWPLADGAGAGGSTAVAITVLAFYAAAGSMPAARSGGVIGLMIVSALGFALAPAPEPWFPTSGAALFSASSAALDRQLGAGASDALRAVWPLALAIYAHSFLLAALALTVVRAQAMAVSYRYREGGYGPQADRG